MMGEEPEREHKGDGRHVVHFEVRAIPPDPIIRISKRFRPEIARCCDRLWQIKAERRERKVQNAGDGSYSRGPVGINVGEMSESRLIRV
ncbi:hypothetical protein Bca52824_085422 [Brassica carinata]|uniref:Uncharacterized protein n=1 Tax=Brassica carinata TaxID=52824 RepID=A0A8X7P4H2_BRACI|nr:hypothetical protein Bca52824_085422 [Brassica carinata]